MDYWIECIAEALEDAGVIATEDQIKSIASCVDGAHENFGTATGAEHIPNPLAEENVQLKRDLEIERDKITCPECKGKGYIICKVGTCHTSESDCSRCRGTGRCSR